MSRTGMTRREFLRASASAAAAGAISGLVAPASRASAAGATPEKPNIVLIVADDFGFECVSAAGGQSYKTPHLDFLATGGTQFEHCYATPLCTPSRVQLMTGQYPFRTGWTGNIHSRPNLRDRVVSPRLPSIARMLKSAGYATAVAGKWQLCGPGQFPKHPGQLGFDRYCLWAERYKNARTNPYESPAVWRDGKLTPNAEKTYGPDVYNQYLLDFITAHKAKPFFAYYPMVLPHPPFTPTPDSAGRGGDVQQIFTDMVAYMDKCVGDVAGHLRKLGLQKNTLLLFTGDNGTPRKIRSRFNGKTIRGGKDTLATAGTHVPLIAHQPDRVPAGKTCGDLIDFSDFLPTLADATGAAEPKSTTFDGRSFAPQLRGEKGDPRQWVYVQLGDRRFVRDKNWTLHSDDRMIRHGGGHYSERLVVKTDRTPADKAAAIRLGAVMARLKK